MAQVNHNYDYLTVVDGQTVWERLRVIRSFLTERRQALKIANLGKEKFEATKDTMDEWDRREAEIMNENQDSLIQDCVDEIAFLEDFESKLAEEAEKERVVGKSDREMYEINFPKESRVRLVNRTKSEMLSVGHITPETMSMIMRDTSVLPALVEAKILSPEAQNAIGAKGNLQLLLEQSDATKF